jgi:hypothetical protein
LKAAFERSVVLREGDQVPPLQDISWCALK